jgi:hypothetical protein
MPRFEPGTSGIRISSVNHSTTTLFLLLGVDFTHRMLHTGATRAAYVVALRVYFVVRSRRKRCFAALYDYVWRIIISFIFIVIISYIFLIISDNARVSIVCMNMA